MHCNRCLPLKNSILLCESESPLYHMVCTSNYRSTLPYTLMVWPKTKSMSVKNFILFITKSDSLESGVEKKMRIFQISLLIRALLTINKLHMLIMSHCSLEIGKTDLEIAVFLDFLILLIVDFWFLEKSLCSVLCTLLDSDSNSI